MSNSSMSANISALKTKILEARSKNDVAILAGHYCLSPELADLSSEGEAESYSFQLGVGLYKSLCLQGVQARLIMWVNDIGISALEREKIKNEFDLPNNYSYILQQENIPIEELEVIFESSSRNKASTLLRKKIKNAPDKFQKYDSTDPALIRCIDVNSCSVDANKTVYAILGPEGAPLVMKEGSNPKCNLILATLFLRIAKNDENLLFVNVFNDIYIERIRLGIFVAKEVYQLPNQFINLFCDDDSYFEENFTWNATEEEYVA